MPLVIVLVVVDRLAKGWAAAHLRRGVDGPNFGPVDLTLVHNEGAAFGMGQGSGAIFVVIALVICVAALAWLVLVKRHYVLEIISLALIVAGGIGNLIDRLTTGYVVDFIRFAFVDFPVFNIADVCVTCGVVLFIIAFIFTPLGAGASSEVNRG